jgi:hypothetical protein
VVSIADLEPGQSVILPDGTLVVRRFGGRLELRGLPGPQATTKAAARQLLAKGKT